ncbi:MAG: hypothetical protein EA358_08610 [Flavobacteriales bacterium]|nr:MAG: hypothetical protein EA358_08610 [Flavobacteriales bacterium]
MFILQKLNMNTKWKCTEKLGLYSPNTASIFEASLSKQAILQKIANKRAVNKTKNPTSIFKYQI